MKTTERITDDEYREAAFDKHASDDCEIDWGWGAGKVRRKDYGQYGLVGAWVAAWVWVHDEDI